MGKISLQFDINYSFAHHQKNIKHIPPFIHAYTIKKLSINCNLHKEINNKYSTTTTTIHITEYHQYFKGRVFS